MNDTRQPLGASPVLEAAVAYVPRVLVEALEREPDRASPWYEHVDGTLVMADVSGFTAMSESLAKAGKEGAEWLTDIINSFFTSMLDIATGFGGTTLTFGGDAILLLFYGPDHERRAVAAALGMLDTAAGLKPYRVDKHRIRLGVSMGAHSGRFLLASLGTAERAQFAILGPETVRTAEAESAANSGELAVTPETARLLGGDAQLEARDAHFVVRSVTGAPPPNTSPSDVPDARLARSLAPYVPGVLAEALTTGSEAAVRLQDHEHRKVTVAFVNVLGVDDILEHEGPKALVEELQRYMVPVVGLTERHSGYLVSNDIYTNGFKLILTFGAPVAHEHATANAVRFAAELRDEVAGLRLSVSHRIGVNGGFVYSGDVGPPYRRQYTVMGDAVNLAARLMSAAQTGEIMASCATAAEAGPRFAVRELSPIRVKGKEEPIAVCVVEGEALQCASPAELAHGLFGREAEMALLEQAARDAGSGKGSAALVIGEAGIGKSRLVLELQERLESAGWTLVKSGCFEHMQHKPFTPWLRVLETLLDIHGLEGDARTQRAVAALDRLAPEMIAFAALLNPMLELAIPPSEAVAALDDGARRGKLIELASSIVVGRAGLGPLLLVVEDAHWADDSSAALLRRVVNDLGSAPALLLATARGDVGALEGLPPGAITTLRLGELPEAAAVQLISTVAGFDALPEAVASAILEKSKGNPLFLEQVAESLAHGAASGVFSGRSGVSVAEQIDSLAIPDRVQGLLMARVDGLPPSEKEVLREASVVGPGFTEEAIEAICDEAATRASLHLSLDGLSRRGLIEPVGRGRAAAFKFRHALIQDVAYDSLRFARRRDLHRRVGRYIEERYSEHLAAHYEVLVHHCVRGQDDTGTRRYAVLAAEKAGGVFAHREAVDYYEMALRATKARTSAGAVDRSRLLESMGDSYELAGAHTEAIQVFHDALTRWCAVRAKTAANDVDADGGDGSTASRASDLCHKIAVAYERDQRHFDKAAAWLGRALADLPPDHPTLEAAVCLTKGYVLMRLGRYDEMAEWTRRGLDLARASGDVGNQAWGLNVLSMHAWLTGDLREAVRYEREAVALFEENGDLRRAAVAHGNLAVFCECVGELADAAEHNRTCIEIYERISYPTGIPIARNNLGEVLVKQGRLDEAVEGFTEAVEACGGTGWTAGLALVNLARVRRMQGRLHDARDFVRRAISLLEHTDQGHLQEALVEETWLSLELGDAESALSRCRELLGDVESLGMKILQSRLLYVRGSAEARLGRASQAILTLRESAAVAEGSGACYEKALALVECGRLLRETGQPEWSVPLDEAIGIFRGMGAARDLASAVEVRGS